MEQEEIEILPSKPVVGDPLRPHNKQSGGQGIAHCA